MQTTRVPRCLPSQELQAVLRVALLDDVRDREATFAQLAQPAEAGKLAARLQLFFAVPPGQPNVSDLRAHVGARSKQDVAQRFDGVLLDAVRGERAREARLRSRAPDPLGIESKNIPAEGDELVQLIQPLELRPEEVRFD